MVTNSVMEALSSIRDGCTAESLEGPHLEFKEDPARHYSPNPDSQRIDLILDEAIAFANAEGESDIVLGVSDRTSGPGAFTGTDADGAWIRQKIFQNTSPQLTVEVEEISFEGARLLVIHVPEGLDVYSRRNGAASVRVAAGRRPMTEDERRSVRFRRANPDFTARPTSSVVGDLDQDALALARRMLAVRNPSEAPTSDEDLVRRLGLSTERGVLTVAGELLLRGKPGGEVIARHVFRRFPGGEPSATEYSGPLLMAVNRVRERVEAFSDPEFARLDLSGGQERPIRDFPTAAIDEAVSNAFVHRDWAMALPVVIDQSPQVLSVDSPGPFPSGVDVKHLLTTRSMPRNQTLMTALHRLGLVEETSRGFDRMWVAMLESGRSIPDVSANEFHVEVTFTAGGLDTAFVNGLAVLTGLGFSTEMLHSVDALLILRRLWQTDAVSLRAASRLLQVDEGECRAILTWLTEEGLLTSDDQRSEEWRLSDRARSALTKSGAELPKRGAAERWILESLAGGKSVTNREASAATGTNSREVTRILRYLADTQRIVKDPEGPDRGPGVRWIAATA